MDGAGDATPLRPHMFNPGSLEMKTSDLILKYFHFIPKFKICCFWVDTNNKNALWISHVLSHASMSVMFVACFDPWETCDVHVWPLKDQNQ